MPIRWIMLIILFAVRLSMGFQFQAVASVTDELVEVFGFSYAEIGTLIGFFLLPGIFIALPSGLMTRALSDKNLLMLGAATMVVGGLMMGMADTPSSLYWGRLITGIGGTIFNVILTKMVTDWFVENELATALAIMLTAWPIGIALGLLTQGHIADSQGWSAVMYATAAFASVALALTAVFYREAPSVKNCTFEPVRFALPRRQLVHVSVAGFAWALFNACPIIIVSFAPSVLIESGYDSASALSITSLFMWITLISVPLGARLVELIGRPTSIMVVAMLVSAAAMLMISQVMVPVLSFVILGLFRGIPTGPLMSLSAQATTPENRGPGLGVFYTWFYVGMTTGPALAGWARDVSGTTAAPIVIAAAIIVVVVVALGAFRVLQQLWPIEETSGNQAG